MGEQAVLSTDAIAIPKVVAILLEALIILFLNKANLGNDWICAYKFNLYQLKFKSLGATYVRRRVATGFRVVLALIIDDIQRLKAP